MDLQGRVLPCIDVRGALAHSLTCPQGTGATYDRDPQPVVGDQPVSTEDMGPVAHGPQSQAVPVVV